MATEHKLIEGVAHMIWHTNKKGPSARRLAHPGTPGVRRRTWALILAFVLFISGVHVLASDAVVLPGTEQTGGERMDFSRSTMLSLAADGSLTIERFQREEDAEAQADQWTILVYLCTSDLADYGLATKSSNEMAVWSYENAHHC